jgi:hypothetical protein
VNYLAVCLTLALLIAATGIVWLVREVRRVESAIKHYEVSQSYLVSKNQELSQRLTAIYEERAIAKLPANHPQARPPKKITRSKKVTE